MHRNVWRVLGAALVLAGIVWAGWWASAPCRPLDRLLGFSGCVNRVTVENVRPLSRAAMTTPDDVASLFGRLREGGETFPGMVRIEPWSGRETGRHRLPVQETFAWMIPAADGERALLACRGRPCAQDGSRALIVSLADGSLLETVDLDGRYPLTLPDEPRPPAPLSRLADEGRTVVVLDERNVLRLRARDGGEIAVLNRPEDRAEPWATRFTVSPSGRYVALLDRADLHGAPSSRFMVWDARTGALVDRREPGRGYRISSDLVWSADERHLMAIHREDWTTVIDIFRLRDPDAPG